MIKKILLAGMLGGLVLLVWTFVLNGFFGFNSRINMKRIPDERILYDVLKNTINKPGRYIVNPELTPDGIFPDGEPVFSIQYSGMGHEAAGRLMPFQLAIYLFSPVIAAWMLSVTNDRVLNSYWRKVLFIAAFGLLFALFCDLMSYGIDGYPMVDALYLAMVDLISWTLVGLAIAWRLQPITGVKLQP
jgi:hypothetical protein